MKINDELLFFIIKSRLFSHLAFFLPPSVKGGASLFFFAFRADRLCPHSSQIPHLPSRPAPFCCTLHVFPPGFGDQLQQSFKLL